MKIEAVFFDMGGTLELVEATEESRARFVRTAQALLGGLAPKIAALSAERFEQIVAAGAKRYKRRSAETEIEERSAAIWGEHVFGEYGEYRPVFTLLGDMLSDLWASVYHTRRLRPEAKEALERLSGGGMRLGIISNTTSRVMPFRQLELYGIRERFETVALSARAGIRKPHPKLFLSAAEKLGVAPDRCAYVGDLFARDVMGANAAGFARCFLIGADEPAPGNSMDYIRIKALTEVAELLFM